MIKRRKKVLNVTDGGRAFPIAPGYFLMKGRTHEQGGIGIGNNLEVEDGEIIKTNKKSLKVLSNAPIMNGISPAQMALGGLNNGTFEQRFNQGFKYQERFKDENGLKDDGTKAQFGTEYWDKALWKPNNKKEINVEIPFALPEENVTKPKTKKRNGEYIGGTPTEARLKALDKMPKVKQRIEELSKSYGIDKNLLTHRFLREGWLDANIDVYNNTDKELQKDYWELVSNQEVSGFSGLGLDDAGSLMPKYNLRRDISYWTDVNENEKGRAVISPYFDNIYDALEVKAADMEYRQNELRKRGISEEDINTYVNAAYNLGLYHKDLENTDWIKENYTVPNYYKLGGMNKQNKKELGGDATISSTGKRKKAIFGKQLTYKDILEKNFTKPINITIPDININGYNNNQTFNNDRLSFQEMVYTAFDKPNINIPNVNVPDINYPALTTNTSIVRKDLTLPKVIPHINNKVQKIIKDKPLSETPITKISFLKANPNFLGNVIGSVANIIGSGISYGVNKNMLNDLKSPRTPYILQANKLKTNININPQLNELRRTVDKYNKFADRNTASSQVAYNRRLGNELSFLENYNQLYGQKENIETQLINQDILNQQEVFKYNLENYNNWINKITDFDNRIIEAKGENAQAFTQNLTGALGNFLNNNAQWRNSMANIAALNAANPDVTPELMYSLGLPYSLWLKQRNDKRARKKNNLDQNENISIN